jgi:aspartyl protease family protein
MAFSSGSRHALREAASWLFAAAVAISTIVYFDELRAGLASTFGLPKSPGLGAEGTDLGAESAGADAAPSSAGSVELRAGRNGHFTTTAHLNGRPVEVLVDTGASMVALSYEDAERAGVFVRPSDFTHKVSTANGTAKIALVTLDSVSIGDITIRDVEAMVGEPGRLGTTLLGMTFLGRLSRAEMRSGVLILQE